MDPHTIISHLGALHASMPDTISYLQMWKREHDFPYALLHSEKEIRELALQTIKTMPFF